MADRETPTPRARVLKWLAGLLVLGLVAAAVGLVFLPDLLPASVVRRKVAAMLSERLGRPVTVASARLDWREGLTARGVRIDRRDREGRLAEVDRLAVRFGPADAARAEPRFRSIRFEGLELWLVMDEAGRLNVADLLEGDALDVGVVQVGSARVHFHNRRTGGRLDFENVHASVGELTDTGSGYVSLSADLCRVPGDHPAAAGPTDAAALRGGRMVLTANIDRRRTGPDGMPVGSLKAEWSDLPWDRLWAAVVPASPAAGLLRRTSGRMSLTLGEKTSSAEGAVEVGHLAWPARGKAAPTPLLPEAILGFRLHWAAAAQRVVLDTLTLSAPGLNLKADGQVAPSRPPAGQEAGDEAAPSWTTPAVKLSAGGTVSWGPLSRDAALLRPVLERFEPLGGKARLVDLRITTEGDLFRLTARADLDDTVMVVPGWFEKQEADPLTLRLEGKCDRGFRTPAAVGIVLETAGTTMEVRAMPPPDAVREVLAGTREDETAWRVRLARLAGERTTAEITVSKVAPLLALVPPLKDRLGTVDEDSKGRASLVVQPVGGGEDASARRVAAPAAREHGAPPEVWTAVLHADLTEAGIAPKAGGGPRKPKGTPASLDADAVLCPGRRRSDLRRLTVRLGKGRLRWDGSARIDWPRKEREQPVGRFRGDLALENLETIGAILAPEAFVGTPPVAGDLVFKKEEMEAGLSEGRFDAVLSAGLDRIRLRLEPYLHMDAGCPAAIRELIIEWDTARWNRVLASAALDLPGAEVAVLGKAVLVDGRPRGGRTGALVPGAPPPLPSILDRFAPNSSADITASVSDLAKAAEMSPLLAEAVEKGRAAGRASGRLLLSRERDAIQGTASLDLTGLDLDLAGRLKKSPGRRLTAEVEGRQAWGPAGRRDIHLHRAEVFLGESRTTLTGLIRLDRPALTAHADLPTRLAAAVRDADVKAEGDWRHGPDLAHMLPGLAPLRARCGLDGATRWTLALEGSPTRGRLDLDVDATECRVFAAPRGERTEAVTVKTAGTPASVDLRVRYGEVPGEMIVEDVHLHLADATAKASGRLLFDDPRFLVPSRPTAWTLSVDGRVPDAAILASLLPWRLADLEPRGAVDLALRAAADARGSEVQSCRLRFDDARLRWLQRDIRLDGALAYDHASLETDGLSLKAGGSDVRIVTYIARPSEDPTGSVIVRGPMLDVEEVLEMIRRTSASLADAAEAPAAPADGLGARIRRLLAAAHLSADVRLDRVAVVNPKWDSRYELKGLEAEGRLADRHLVLPRFACRLNDGTVTGRLRLDFRQAPPLLHVAYDARDLQVRENLKPFINTTFPGMQVNGTLTTRATRTQPLASGTHPVGGGETILTDGLLEGPAAPEYVTAILPGLKLTRYAFNRMSNVFEQRPGGVTDNRMLFDGKAYDLFIFGRTHPDGTTRYTMGVDLLLSLGSEVSRTLDQGKLPLMHYNGRIVGKAFAERQVSYVLPHELAYDVFLRRNLLLQLVRRLGRPEPKIEKPDAVPPEERRSEPPFGERRPGSGLAEPRPDTPAP